MDVGHNLSKNGEVRDETVVNLTMESGIGGGLGRR